MISRAPSPRFPLRLAIELVTVMTAVLVCLAWHSATTRRRSLKSHHQPKPFKSPGVAIICQRVRNQRSAGVARLTCSRRQSGVITVRVRLKFPISTAGRASGMWILAARAFPLPATIFVVIHAEPAAPPAQALLPAVAVRVPTAALALHDLRHTFASTLRTNTRGAFALRAAVLVSAATRCTEH